MLLTAAFVMSIALAPAKASKPDTLIPPAVPVNLEAPPGHRPFMITSAQGTQNYICVPSPTGVAWSFLGPQATLFNDRTEQVLSHFLSPNPDENAMPRATWQHSRDSSAVWAVAIESSSDAAYVAAGAIPWLLLEVVGAEYGPEWGDKMLRTRFIQRVNTSGGVAPASGCSAATDVGKRQMVPYSTVYVFYR